MSLKRQSVDPWTQVRSRLEPNNNPSLPVSSSFDCLNVIISASFPVASKMSEVGACLCLAYLLNSILVLELTRLLNHDVRSPRPEVSLMNVQVLEYFYQHVH